MNRDSDRINTAIRIKHLFGKMRLPPDAPELRLILLGHRAEKVARRSVIRHLHDEQIDLHGATPELRAV
jgi:hypothetical protein